MNKKIYLSLIFISKIMLAPPEGDGWDLTNNQEAKQPNIMEEQEQRNSFKEQKRYEASSVSSEKNSPVDEAEKENNPESKLNKDQKSNNQNQNSHENHFGNTESDDENRLFENRKLQEENRKEVVAEQEEQREKNISHQKESSGKLPKLTEILANPKKYSKDISKISPAIFLELFNQDKDEKAISQIFKNPDLYKKLNEEQVETIFEYLVTNSKIILLKNMLNTPELVSKICSNQKKSMLDKLVPKIDPDVFKNSEIVSNLLDYPNFLKELTQDQIKSLNFTGISFEKFVRLPDESIKFLLDKPNFYKKLNEVQVKTIFEYLVVKSKNDLLAQTLNTPELLSLICSEQQDKGLTLQIYVPKINPDVFKNSEIVSSLLRYPNFLKELTPDQIASFQDLSSLPKERIQALFQAPDVFKKLTKKQVQTINPEILSQVLKEKIETPLDLAFAKKLSWQQIRQLLGDHTGWRFKNLFTKFKVNFTADALRNLQNRTAAADALENLQNRRADKKNNEQDEDSSLEMYDTFEPFEKDDQQKFNTQKDNQEKKSVGNNESDAQKEQNEKEKKYLVLELSKLPQDKRPQNIDQAVDYMQEGENLWNVLKEDNSTEILKQIIAGMPNSTSLTEGNKKLLTDVFNGKTVNDQNDELFQSFMKSYQTVIIKLQWYFYKLSILEDGRAFQGGAITFEDKNKVLFNFLKKYTKLINPNYDSGSLSWGAIAYARTSSHFKEKNSTQENVASEHIGIDMKLSPGELGLPLNAPHLLFGQRSNGYVFVKCEPHGMSTVEDVLTHGWSWVKTRGENDESKHSKDRVPADVKNEFWKLYNDQKTKKQSVNKKEIESQGIAGMLKSLSSDSQGKFKTYLTQERSKNPALRNFQANNLSNRRGGEAIINP